MVMKVVILIFGLLFGYRMIEFNKQNEFFDQNILKNSLVIIIFLTLLSLIFFVRSSFLLWLMVISWIFLVKVTIFVTAHVREERFRQDFVEFLDRIIVHLRSGESLRSSLDKSNVDTSALSRAKVSKLIEAALFSQKVHSNSVFVQEIFVEFKSAVDFPQKTLDRILAFRRKLKIEDYFRRKSGAVLRQIKIQAVFLTILYVAVQIFVVQRFGFKENLQLEVISIALFMLGLLILFYKGSQKIWKI